MNRSFRTRAVVFFVLLGAAVAAPVAWAQTATVGFTTSFADQFGDATEEFCATVTISSDVAFDLGNSQFIFTYNGAALSFANPPVAGTDYVFDNYGSGNYSASVTHDPGANEISVNILLTSVNNGSAVPTGGLDVVRIYFTVVDPVATAGLIYSDPLSQIFEDDNTTPVTDDYNNSDPVLPVELTSFEAKLEADAVLLQWATAGETNNAGFEVQQRLLASSVAGRPAGDGAAWAPVHFVEGAGTTTEPQQYRHRVEALPPGRYAFRLKQIDFDGAFVFGPEVEVELEVPRTLALKPNYPNPFNPRTTIVFTVPDEGQAVLTVYDMLGREVAVLFDGPAQPGKQHEVTFEAGSLATGLYVYTLEHGGQRLTRSLMLMK